LFAVSISFQGFSARSTHRYPQSHGPRRRKGCDARSHSGDAKTRHAPASLEGEALCANGDRCGLDAHHAVAAATARTPDPCSREVVSDMLQLLQTAQATAFPTPAEHHSTAD
jgi:hypothetical protein